MEKLKYQGYSILLQEVPGELTLAFSISGCPYKCRGCHSKYLWEYEGHYLIDEYYDVLDNYKDFITCVCFMGGDQNEDELIKYCTKAHELGLKTCLYTGASYISNKLCDNLDYLKIGPYIEECGGLDKPTTNQKMYEVIDGGNGKDLIDITYKFSKEYRFKDIVK